MIPSTKYMPILKWKMGEYQALERLDNAVKSNIVPLFEIPTIGYDFEKSRNSKTVDEHLTDFGKRLKAKWDARPCLVDLQFIAAMDGGENCTMEDGQHCVDVLFADAREKGCHAVPVITFQADNAFKQAVSRVVQADKRGVCLRINVPDFDRASLQQDIAALLNDLGVNYADTDLVLDLKAPDYQSLNMAAKQAQAFLGMLPVLNRWRSVVVSATSYPSSAAGVAKNTNFVALPRQEWKVYKLLIGMLGTTTTLPAFGDYAVASPEMVSLDMRLIKPSAKLRYTYDDHWHVAVGKTVRSAGGFGQYRPMCETLVKQPYFDGRGTSFGDDYIADCAEGKVGTGSLTTWVSVGTNRHLTKVNADLASFHALSVAA